MGGEKVVVILDASKDLNCSGIIQSLCGLPLYPGDELILLGVLRLVSSPTGHNTKVDTNSTKSRFLMDEFSRKEEQLYQALEILKETRMGKSQIKLDVALRAGSPRKAVVVEAVVNFGATWIILDRVMKKDKKYFVKNLPCKISKFKRNNIIDLLREPLATVTVSIDGPPNKSPNSNGQVSYDEMIPVFDTKNNTTEYSTALEMSSNSTMSLDQKQQNHIITVKDKFSPHHQAPDQYLEETERTEGLSGTSYPDDNLQKEPLKTYICSVCENRRPRIRGHRDFKYVELYEATKGFSDDNFLGEGGFGSVYKGELTHGMKIAVKQHKGASLQGEKEFKAEVQVLSKVRHENLVMLLGSCSDGSQRLLVYEYVCNGSLDDHLSKNENKIFSWEQRMKIALGTAKGLQYLHSHNIVHRDMRPNNILITHDYESLLGDFGLAKTQQDSNSDNSVVGTLGYMAPEYAQTGKFSTKTDVFSFGMVLLQLITGRRTTDTIPGGRSLIKWAKPLLKDRNYPDLIDRRIIDSHDVLQLFWMVQLTEKCISNDPCERFTMEKVVKTLISIRDGNTPCTGYVSPISD